MNSKTPKKTTKAKTAVKVKDLKPKKDAKGGVLIGLLLPAVQKIRG